MAGASLRVTAATVRVTPLARVRAELEAARRRAHAIADPVDERAWAARPTPSEWSLAECLAHLTLTSHAMIPAVRHALEQSRAAGGTARARMDLAGALLWWALTLRVPVRTTAPFEPLAVGARHAVLAEFDGLQDELLTLVERAKGVDLVAMRIVSPFDARLRYNAYAALRIVAAHQRLHLAQGERAVRASRS